MHLHLPETALARACVAISIHLPRFKNQKADVFYVFVSY